MNQLSQLMKTVPDNLDRRSQLIRQLKDSQHNLLNVLMYMVDTVLPEGKTAREFQAKYPDDLPLDQIYGMLSVKVRCNLWYIVVITKGQSLEQQSIKNHTL